jgi:hypothetical protein
MDFAKRNSGFLRADKTAGFIWPIRAHFLPFRPAALVLFDLFRTVT